MTQIVKLKEDTIKQKEMRTSAIRIFMDAVTDPGKNNIPISILEEQTRTVNELSTTTNTNKFRKYSDRFMRQSNFFIQPHFFGITSSG